MLPNITELGLTGAEKIFRVELIDTETYHVQPLFNMKDFVIKRNEQKIWEVVLGQNVEPDIVMQLGEDLNYIDSMEFQFPLVYNGEAVMCRIATGESGYGVLFDDKLIAEVNMSGDGVTWEVTSGGPLDDDTLYEIGRQIEHHTA